MLDSRPCYGVAGHSELAAIAVDGEVLDQARIQIVRLGGRIRCVIRLRFGWALVGPPPSLELPPL